MMHKIYLKYQKGQTLLELIVVIAVTLIIVTALVFATLSSLRNAQFAKAQVQATKLAQEGLEKVRASRDRNGDDIKANYTGDTTYEIKNWKEFWSDIGTLSPSGQACYYKFQPNEIIYTNYCSNLGAELPDNELQVEYIQDKKFKRVIYFSGDNNTRNVTIIVSWSDFSGSHESKITTILKNPNL